MFVSSGLLSGTRRLARDSSPQSARRRGGPSPRPAAAVGAHPVAPAGDRRGGVLVGLDDDPAARVCDGRADHALGVEPRAGTPRAAVRHVLSAACTAPHAGRRVRSARTSAACQRSRFASSTRPKKSNSPTLASHDICRPARRRSAPVSARRSGARSRAVICAAARPRDRTCHPTSSSLNVSGSTGSGSGSGSTTGGAASCGGSVGSGGSDGC